MKDVVIVSGARTAQGKFSGSLKGFSAPQLGGMVIKEAVMKSMGVGVNVDLKDIEVVKTQDYEAIVSLKNEAMDRFLLLEGKDLKVESTKIEEFMISIACLY